MFRVAPKQKKCLMGGRRAGACCALWATYFRGARVRRSLVCICCFAGQGKGNSARPALSPEGEGLAMCETWRAAPQTDVVFTEAPRGHLGAAGGFKTFVATSAWPRVGALCGARHNAAFADVASSEEELRGGGSSRGSGRALSACWAMSRQ